MSLSQSPSINCSLRLKRLNQQGIETFGFGGDKSEEPSVIGWMPSAQIYFRDPDGHMLEFISILPEKPDRISLGLTRSGKN